MFELVVNEKPPLNWRAAWVFDICCENNPKLFEPYLVKIIHLLPEVKNDGLKRIFTRMLSRATIPDDEEMLGLLVNTCFNWLNSPLEPVATRVHSMQILYNVSNMLPDLKNELIYSIENFMPEGTGGFKSRGGKLLKKLYVEILEVG